MELVVRENKLHDQEQTIDLNSSVLTLIGENGCGKSSILESIFNEYLNSEDYKVICFSSGQNELFSNLFNKHKRASRRYLKEENSPINSFYFNYHWVRILVFFASTLRPDGLVRGFLVDRGYIDEEEIVAGGEKEDKSSEFHIRFRIRKYYRNKIQNEIAQEANSIFDENARLLRNTEYHLTLEKIISEFHLNFDFGDDTKENLRKTWLKFTSNNAYRIFTHKDVDKIFSFWALATYSWEANSEIEESKLYFKNKLEFEQLSDGEYQLLSIYAMIDLFDSENTIFLFDEIDSHLYFKNLEKLWSILQNSIKGKVITTTHISDSILSNDFTNIKLVQHGLIEHDLTLKELAKRLTNIVGKESYEYDLASRVKNIILMDDEVDFIIFKKLAIKKNGEEAREIMERVIPFKRESNYDNPNIHLGKSKLNFAQDFIKRFDTIPICTKNIFLICDRDKFSHELIDENLKVNISDEYKEVKNNKKVKTHLLCWRRNEIENYLLSYTLLKKKGLLESFVENLSNQHICENDNLDANLEVLKYETKDLLHPLYKTNGFNETELDDLISLIPKEEISDDIIAMYNYLKTNITN